MLSMKARGMALQPATIEPPAVELPAPEPVDQGYQHWLSTYYPHVARADLAPHHHDVWQWAEAIEAGKSCEPKIVIWGRGQAKSSTAELIVSRLEQKLTRRFCLYVSGTGEQAAEHVQAIATYLEQRGVKPAVGVTNQNKAWSQTKLTTENGFHVVGVGLQSRSLRGIKRDQYRPDLIVFDDLDNVDDTPERVQKMIGHLLNTILPAGSTDVAVLGIQNLIHDNGIFAKLARDEADFLLDRQQGQPIPAVLGLEVEERQNAHGRTMYVITGGEPTWPGGQSLETCQAQINRWGYRTFLREAQHDVQISAGKFFDVSRLGYCEWSEVPELAAVARAWDFAATEGAGDYTAGVLMGRGVNGKYYVLDVRRGRWEASNIRLNFAAAARSDIGRWGLWSQYLPEDRGAAGKLFVDAVRALFPKLTLVSHIVSGKKAQRAFGFSNEVNSGNVVLVAPNPADMADEDAEDWRPLFVRELKQFREDEKHEHDDQVDAAADAFNQVYGEPAEVAVYELPDRPQLGGGSDPFNLSY